MTITEPLQTLREKVLRRNPAQPEFNQAVHDALDSLGPVSGIAMQSSTELISFVENSRRS